MIPSQSPDPSNDPTTSAQDLVDDQNTPSEPAQPKTDPKVKKRNDDFKARVAQCKRYRTKLIANWAVNIDYRRGKPFASQTDQDQIAVNLDWSLTKVKQAALFSQVPQVRLDSPDVQVKSAPWAVGFGQKLNEFLIQAGIESAMNEVLPDCINAAGIGAILVSYDCITEDRQVPKLTAPAPTPVDPNVPPATPQDPTQDPSLDPDQDGDNDQANPDESMETIPYIIDHRYLTERLSPTDLLWPINFTGANFDNAGWIGRSGRITWEEAMLRFKLTEEDKDKVLGEDKPTMDRLTHDTERDKSQADEMVGFDEIFYREFKFSEGSQSYSAIHHLVFVSGKDDPVIDEPWKGQKIDPQAGILGATKFPIRVLTLTYITDETIPPSDTAIGRPQVDEINKGRTQMNMQRARAIPIRWFDVNRIDPSMQINLMRGTWDGMIPVQGEGTRVLGEIAPPRMPQDNFAFDKIAKADLLQGYGSHLGSQDEEFSETDPLQNKQGFNNRIGQERARVASFFVGVAEVLAGLMSLYEEPSSLGEGFTPEAAKVFRYSILADSTVLLDANQKIARLNQFINLYAKSGWINLEAVLQEIATLSGLDPTLVIQPPQPKPPVEPNISLRLTGVEDMLNPLALAFLIKSGQAPPPPMIEQAKALIQQAVVPPQGMQMPGSVQPVGGLPMLPQGAPPPVPGAAPSGPPLAPPVPAPHPGTPLPPPPPPKVGEAHPQLSGLEAINKRTESGGKQ